jgi:hypothetical protein
LDNLISTVSHSQRDILLSILQLYVPGGRFDLDPTFSKGAFYDGVLLPYPKHCSDLNPQNRDEKGYPYIQAADCRSLMFESASLGSIVFDPPFIHAHGKGSEIGNRFSSYPTQHALRAMYMASLVEFYRVLKTKGVLVFKCQDIIESGKQVMNHCIIWQMANSLGFVDLDLFILTADHRMVGHNHHEQQHARKFHSYFWVFEKGTRR